MEYIVVCLAALIASGLTLFSGFGLGTLLMPVVAIFFPIEIAIAITAIVHLANNLFKVGLMGGKAERSILIKFGVPAVLAALFGAALLNWIGAVPPVYQHTAFGRELEISPVKLIIGVLIILFVVLELSKRFSRIKLDRKWLPLGGVISGFFGGLSGHQGAFRSMFLLKAGLGKEAFVATGIVLAVMVDLSRMTIYGMGALAYGDNVHWGLAGAASISAFLGAYVGARVLKKVTIRAVQLTVSVLLIVVATGLMTGLL
jgi:hypothetical protein